MAFRPVRRVASACGNKKAAQVARAALVET
jgi:hypothetical protein